MDQMVYRVTGSIYVTKSRLFSRQNEGDSLMVWGTYSAESTTELAFLEHKRNAEDYLNTFETYMLSSAYAFYGKKNFRFL